MWGPAFSDSGIRGALTLQGYWSVESAVADPIHGVAWKTELTGPLDGGAFVQTRAYPFDQAHGCIAKKLTTGACKRIRIRAEKPGDKVASFAVQFPGRTFAITAPEGAPFAEILLNEISLNDIGDMSLMLNVTGAVEQSFGMISLRTHDQEITPAATAALSSDGRVLRDGDAIKKGWRFLFFGTAKGVDVVENPADLLSLCGFFPNGEIRCSEDNRMSFYVTERGEYLFVSWNTRLQSSRISIRGA
ncbi:MAG: hypothetical protein A2428_03180 [Bdellovibrionales bacterium RIFOXYC1_FULL_54_43]|nr:MAG: hypothetical protein A2428_03180 [Bdellovibrionales bacterium RIFOXYC1_FULL_54_43]OFZ82684.1 MAG: hypothetical protein A2603_02615 [Bdellovibrionales bacterium RIFOXYD1_FULL_55_31]